VIIDQLTDGCRNTSREISFVVDVLPLKYCTVFHVDRGVALQWRLVQRLCACVLRNLSQTPLYTALCKRQVAAFTSEAPLIA
jgi:hypothetical protein